MNRRVLLIGLPAAFAVLAAGYGAFWWAAATRAIDGLERWAEERREAGWTVAYSAPRATGFPFRLTLEVRRPAIEVPTAQGSLSWSGAALYAQTRPWRFRRIDVTVSGHHAARYVHLPSRGAAVAQGQGGNAVVTVGPDGRPRQVRISLSGLSLDAPFTAQGIRVGGLAVAMTPSEAGALPRTVSMTATDVELPPEVRAPFGRAIQRIELAAVMEKTLRAGPIPDALAAWRDAGGAIDIERAAVIWGPLEVSVKGRLSLDEALQPAGAFTVQARGFNEALAELARRGEIEADSAAAAGIVITLLARPGPDGALRATVPVSIENRIVTAGPRSLARLPRIVW